MRRFGHLEFNADQSRSLVATVRRQHHAETGFAPQANLHGDIRVGGSALSCLHWPQNRRDERDSCAAQQARWILFQYLDLNSRHIVDAEFQEVGVGVKVEVGLDVGGPGEAALAFECLLGTHIKGVGIAAEADLSQNR